VTAVTVGFVMAAVLFLSPGSARAIAPYAFQQITNNNEFDGPPSVNGGRVVWIRDGSAGAVLCLYDALVGFSAASSAQTWGLSLLAEHRANARVAEHNSLLVKLPPDDEATSAEGPMPRQEVAQVMYNMMKQMPWVLPYPPD
jgi:hypothetical protein